MPNTTDWKALSAWHLGGISSALKCGQRWAGTLHTATYGQVKPIFCIPNSTEGPLSLDGPECRHLRRKALGLVPRLTLVTTPTPAEDGLRQVRHAVPILRRAIYGLIEEITAHSSVLSCLLEKLDLLSSRRELASTGCDNRGGWLEHVARRQAEAVDRSEELHVLASEALRKYPGLWAWFRLGSALTASLGPLQYEAEIDLGEEPDLGPVAAAALPLAERAIPSSPVLWALAKSTSLPGDEDARNQRDILGRRYEATTEWLEGGGTAACLDTVKPELPAPPVPPLKLMLRVDRNPDAPSITYKDKRYNVTIAQAIFFDHVVDAAGGWVSTADLGDDQGYMPEEHRDRVVAGLPRQIRDLLEGKGGSGYRLKRKVVEELLRTTP